MTNFGSLFRLLETLDKEVSGRQAVTPPMEIQGLLRDLMQGNLSAKQRKVICEKLLEEPGWIAWFAEEIKANRTR